MSVIFWRINKRNEIAVLPDSVFDSTAGFLQNESQYVTRGPGDSINPQYGPITNITLPRQNLGALRTDGFDVELNYQHAITGYGRLTAHLSGTYVADFQEQDQPSDPYVQYAGAFNAYEQISIPRWRHVASLDWTYGAWSTTLTDNFQLGYRDQNNDQNGNVRRVGDSETYDWQGTYMGIKRLKISAGVRNLLDRAPPFSNQSQFYLAAYDPTYADVRGRFYYASLSWTFK
jgi:iron complex outermembrane receptor protein